MEKFAELIEKLSKMSEKGLFGKELFRMGETQVTLTTIIELILIIIAFFIASKLLGRFLRKRVLPRFHLDAGAQYNIIRLLHYCILVLGILFALGMVGIQLTSLAVVFGLIGVGIAFGLQNITSNFVSGIILLFERPCECWRLYRGRRYQRSGAFYQCSIHNGYYS